MEHQLCGKPGVVENSKQIAIRDWAALPEGFLEEVLERLPLGDCLSFSKVCKSWRIIVTRLFQGRSCGIPWLVKHGVDQKDCMTRSCFSIVQDLGFEIELPEAYGKYVSGSFQDWLVLAEPRIGICLLNPFSGTKILLPDMINLYSMVVLSAVPTDANCVFALVGTITGSFAFWTPGAPGWHNLELHTWPVEDAVYYKGCFYFLESNYSIGIIDTENVLSTLRRKNVADEIKVQLLPVKMPHGSMTNWVKKYLVECGGEMLLVCRFFRDDDLETSGFETYRLDLSQMTWDKLESLGDWILFVGKGCSRSFPAKQLGDGMANCIYYSNNIPNVPANEWVLPLEPWRDSDADDWGVFSLQNKEFSTRGRPKSQAPIWITAPIWWYFRNINC